MFIWDFDVFAPLKARDLAAARVLLASGGGLDQAIAADGDTFLHGASRDGDLEKIEFLLEFDCARAIESFDDLNKTPLIWAAENGHSEVVARLLLAGANPNANDESNIGNTAIREAVRGGHAEIVALLLEAGADPTIPGWMQLSAVDQAYAGIDGGSDTEQAIAILAMLASFPSRLRDRQQGAWPRPNRP